MPRRRAGSATEYRELVSLPARRTAGRPRRAQCLEALFQRIQIEAEAEAMRAYLNAWQSDHPRAERKQPYEGLSDREIEQLRSIGYLE